MIHALASRRFFAAACPGFFIEQAFYLHRQITHSETNRAGGLEDGCEGMVVWG
jgi:hypothetical protein